MIRLLTISGSIRPDNYTRKALNIVHEAIERRADIKLTKIDPADLHLPLPGQTVTSENPAQLQEAVRQATGIILATPEYHGSFSSVIKLVIENLGFPSLLSGKPIALLGVAAGQIGAVKSLEHLRSVCSHVGGIVLPGPVSIANVQSIFDDQGNCRDERIEKRICSVAVTLIDYIRNNLCPRIALEEMTRNPS